MFGNTNTVANLRFEVFVVLENGLFMKFLRFHALLHLLGPIFGPHSVGFQFNHFSALQCQFFGNQNLGFGQGEFQKLDLNSLHRVILFWPFFLMHPGPLEGLKTSGFRSVRPSR